jgi:hypothetical protein
MLLSHALQPFVPGYVPEFLFSPYYLLYSLLFPFLYISAEHKTLHHPYPNQQIETLCCHKNLDFLQLMEYYSIKR